MATRAVSTTIVYRAWDTSANAPKTGDVANHTLRWVKDGVNSIPSGSPAELDATNNKGLYSLALSTSETNCTFGALGGVSSTANIAIFGPQIAFEYIPNSPSGASGGLPLASDASGRVSLNSSQTTVTIGAVNAYTGNTPQTGDAYGLLNSAQGEPGQGAPAVNAAPISKLAYLFKAWRNRLDQTATTFSLYADDATTVDQKATVSDDGTTFTRGEIGTGP